MSSADEAVALFVDLEPQASEACTLPYRPYPGNRAHDAWTIRRAIVRARSALTSMQTHEAARATAHVRRLLTNRGEMYFPGYLDTLRLLEAFLLVAEDDLTGARNVLVSLHYSRTIRLPQRFFAIWNGGTASAKRPAHRTLPIT